MMETYQIANYLRDRAARSGDHSMERMLMMAAKRLEELDKPKKTAHWISHGEDDERWVECSNCLTMGCSRWKVCPVCERKMEDNNG